MYDCLNGEQVKCFYSMIYFKEDEKYSFCKSGGGLRGYVSGSKLPLKTLHYKYPDNFLILDGNCGILHTIKDGKLYSTESISELKEIDNYSLEYVYGYNGEELNIKNIEDIKEYPSALKERASTITKIYREHQPSADKLIKISKFMNCDKSNCLSAIDFFEKQDYVDFNKFLKSLHIAISVSIENPEHSKNIIKSFLSDNFIGDKIVSFINNKTEELFYRYAERGEEEKKKVDSVLNPYLDSFNSRWIKENNHKLETRVGRYISVIHELEKLKEEYGEFFKEKDMDSYIECKKELSSILKDNTNALELYVKWLNPSKKKLKIINAIVNSLEN